MITDADEGQQAGLDKVLGEARGRFLDAVSAIRPRLHQFCTRMSGSVFDGEDLVQETLADAFFKLPGLRDETRLEPWLFAIAHNKAIDFLRRRGQLSDSEVEDDRSTPVTPEDEVATAGAVDAALTRVISALPPKERACVVLKDVLGYSLEETAEIAATTVTGAKAALHRGRKKLARGEHEARPPLDAGETALLRAYVQRFNQHDWDAVRELIKADARLELVGFLEAHGVDFIAANYFRNYAGMRREWRFRACLVDGLPVAVMDRRDGDEWQVHSAFCLVWTEGRVAAIRDYIHVPYLLAQAAVLELDNDVDAASLPH